MRVTLFDYGAGNLHSLAKAIVSDTIEVRLETDPLRAIDTDVLVLPGVGAFGPAAERFGAAREPVRDAIARGLPTLGICLCMQLLFDSSEEGAGDGLGVFSGKVTALRAARSPQIGWNTIDEAVDPLLAGAPLATAYYANRYACRPTDESIVTAWSTHEEDRFPAIVRRGAIVGVQFHPEKSSAAGVHFVRAYLAEVFP
ncbi:MAG: imidazole glycerol phosphate synthase subunit HisH [Gemmatimonadaceae bacterium]